MTEILFLTRDWPSNHDPNEDPEAPAEVDGEHGAILIITEDTLGNTAAAEYEENGSAHQLRGELLQDLQLRPGHVRLHDQLICKKLNS